MGDEPVEVRAELIRPRAARRGFFASCEASEVVEQAGWAGGGTR